MADTSTVGGVISGYWATGRLKTATPPASVTRMDSTEAKIGRSMKKRVKAPMLASHLCKCRYSNRPSLLARPDLGHGPHGVPGLDPDPPRHRQDEFEAQHVHDGPGRAFESL